MSHSLTEETVIGLASSVLLDPCFGSNLSRGPPESSRVHLPRARENNEGWFVWSASRASSLEERVDTSEEESYMVWSSRSLSTSARQAFLDSLANLLLASVNYRLVQLLSPLPHHPFYFRLEQANMKTLYIAHLLSRPYFSLSQRGIVLGTRSCTTSGIQLLTYHERSCPEVMICELTCSL
ncbi:hypothetical protein IQ07DRAFT_287305 [Pyrenochaeta sp. DS3sAY3a]|nr:hypothetical protein IQ07DRAFT_287305 [Pyrenochaeta sp. DS3sAY3a]